MRKKTKFGEIFPELLSGNGGGSNEQRNSDKQYFASKKQSKKPIALLASSVSDTILQYILFIPHLSSISIELKCNLFRVGQIAEKVENQFFLALFMLTG
jgi:hypothetical protein